MMCWRMLWIVWGVVCRGGVRGEEVEVFGKEWGMWEGERGMMVRELNEWFIIRKEMGMVGVGFGVDGIEGVGSLIGVV